MSKGAILPELGTRSRIVMADLVAATPRDAPPIRAVISLERLINRDDSEILIDDQERLLLGVHQ
jgi:hypothetical protein